MISFLVLEFEGAAQQTMPPSGYAIPGDGI